MSLNALAMFVAIVLSVAAGIISVLGLAAIFSGSYWGVIIVASILEISKVVTAAWLKRHWSDISGGLKTYLTIAVIFLMMITSLGIYGFFSRAHIEQQVTLETGEVSKIPILDSQIASEREKMRGIDEQIKQINDALNAMTTKGKAGDAKKAIDEASRQRKTLDSLRNDKNVILTKIGEIEQAKLALENTKKKNEAETGPLKYLAAWYYGASASGEQLEHSVRILILTLVFVFDPLAVALVIASGTKFVPQEKPKLPSFSNPVAVKESPKGKDPDQPIRVGRKAFKPTKKQKRENYQAQMNRDKVLNLNRLKLG